MEKIKRLVKYLLIFMTNLLIIRYVPEYKLPTIEVLYISIIIQIFYMIIDYKNPNIKLINN